MERIEKRKEVKRGRGRRVRRRRRR